MGRLNKRRRAIVLISNSCQGFLVKRVINIKKNSFDDSNGTITYRRRVICDKSTDEPRVEALFRRGSINIAGPRYSPRSRDVKFREN